MSGPDRSVPTWARRPFTPQSQFPILPRSPDRDQTHGVGGAGPGGVMPRQTGQTGTSGNFAHISRNGRLSSTLFVPTAQSVPTWLVLNMDSGNASRRAHEESGSTSASRRELALKWRHAPTLAEGRAVVVFAVWRAGGSSCHPRQTGICRRRPVSSGRLVWGLYPGHAPPLCPAVNEGRPAGQTLPGEQCDRGIQHPARRGAPSPCRPRLSQQSSDTQHTAHTTRPAQTQQNQQRIRLPARRLG